MKKVMCDQCRKETEPDVYGLAPSGQGWLSVSPRDEHRTLDFCSPACGITALQAREAARIPPLTEPAADAAEFVL